MEKLKQIKDTLPDKLSDLLLVSLADIEKVENSKKFKFDMNSWVDGFENSCYVCHAGAVMVGTLAEQPYMKKILKKDYYDLGPDRFKKTIRNKLYAINLVRVGNIKEALKRVYGRSVVHKISPLLKETIKGLEKQDISNYLNEEHSCTFTIANASHYNDFFGRKNKETFKFYKLYIETVAGILASEGF